MEAGDAWAKILELFAHCEYVICFLVEEHLQVSPTILQGHNPEREILQTTLFR